MNKKRIFIGPHEVAGYYINLYHGFLQNNIQCDLCLYKQHPFNYQTNKQNKILILIQFFNHRLENNKRKLASKLDKFILYILLLVWGIVAIFKYDVFIFGFGQTLWPRNIDLPLLYFLRKKVIINLAHGSDARPPYLDGYYAENDEITEEYIIWVKEQTEKLSTKIKFIEKYATTIIGNPCSTPFFLAGHYINTFFIGAPAPIITKQKSVAKKPNTESICIIHAPSNPIAKGSVEIVNVIESLKAEGFPLRLIMLNGVPNSVVLSELQGCDFVIDQLYSDTPMAGLPTEAACFGKPSLVSGYGFDYLRTLIPSEKLPPSITCRPEHLESKIREIITQPRAFQECGHEAFQYIKNFRNAKNVAKRYQALIEGVYPLEWCIDSRSSEYVSGAGRSIEKTSLVVNQIVSRYGIDALCLSHNKALERQVLKTFVRTK